MFSYPHNRDPAATEHCTSVSWSEASCVPRYATIVYSTHPLSTVGTNPNVQSIPLFPPSSISPPPKLPLTPPPKTKLPSIRHLLSRNQDASPESSPVGTGGAPHGTNVSTPTPSPSSVSMKPMYSSPPRLEQPDTRRRLSIRDLIDANNLVSKSSSDPPAPAPKPYRTPSRSHRRQCKMFSCTKYGLAGGMCIRHGGGKRCGFNGCQTVAQSGGRCKAHGGGSKCKVQGCSSVARRQGLCMGHGGRQPCKVDGCGKCAHGGGHCISHGGGKRCATGGCLKSAQSGGHCYSHGGGKRCADASCMQAARKGGLCIRHRKARMGSGGN